MLVDGAIVLGRFVGKDLGGLFERVDSYVSHRHVERLFMRSRYGLIIEAGW
jgi:hypothetical protein